MNEEALRRFANHIKKTASGGPGGAPRPPAGLFAGGGLLLALIGGGFALASSLVTGTRLLLHRHLVLTWFQSMVVTVQSSIRGLFVL